MYSQRRNRRDRDRRQDGNGGRKNSGHSLQHPFLWGIHIFAFITGCLFWFAHLIFMYFNFTDLDGTGRFYSLLIFGGLFGLLTLAITTRTRQPRQERPAERLVEPNAGLGEYEIPPAPTEPEPARSPNRPTRRNRRRSRHRR